MKRESIYQGAPAERVLLVVGDIDRDGEDEIITAGRVGEQGMYWLDRQADGTWSAHLIDNAYGRLDAGGVLFDVDEDGRLDFIAGGDYRGNQLYWWQCPADPTQRWHRRVICEMEGNQSHDQIVVDLDGDGRAELYFWNQGARGLFMVPVPDDPRVSPWPGVSCIAKGVAEEGFAVADVDGDGRLELIAGLSWYKAIAPGQYESHRFAEGFVSPRLAAADFDGDGRVEIVLGKGDASFMRKGPDGEPGWGRLAMFKRGADPTTLWHGEVIHERLEDPHSVFVADLDGNGTPVLLVGELGDPNGKHRHAPALRLYRWQGGRMVEQIIDSGQGTHEAKPLRVGGELCIAGKPYRNLRGDRRMEDDQVHLWTAMR